MMNGAPFIRVKRTSAAGTWTRIFSLLPAFVAGICFFKFSFLLAAGLSVFSCVAAEFLGGLASRKKKDFFNGTAVLSGLIIVFLLPAGSPWWFFVCAGLFAMWFGKEIFGGAFQEFLNPVLLAAVFLFFLFPGYWQAPSSAADMPDILFPFHRQAPMVSSFLNGFFHSSPVVFSRSLGLAFVAGGVLLLSRRVIPWSMPFYFLGTLAFVSWFLGKEPAHEILSGSVLLAALYLVTDFPSIPLSESGRNLFAILAGLGFSFLRWRGVPPEQAIFFLLLGNSFAPWFDRRPKTGRAFERARSLSGNAFFSREAVALPQEAVGSK